MPSVPQGELMGFCSPGQIPRILLVPKQFAYGVLRGKYRSELTECDLGLMDGDTTGETG